MWDVQTNILQSHCFKESWCLLNTLNVGDNANKNVRNNNNNNGQGWKGWWGWGAQGARRCTRQTSPADGHGGAGLRTQPPNIFTGRAGGGGVWEFAILYTIPMNFQPFFLSFFLLSFHFIFCPPPPPPPSSSSVLLFPCVCVCMFVKGTKLSGSLFIVCVCVYSRLLIQRMQCLGAMGREGTGIRLGRVGVVEAIRGAEWDQVG